MSHLFVVLPPARTYRFESRGGSQKGGVYRDRILDQTISDTVRKDSAIYMRKSMVFRPLMHVHLLTSETKLGTYTKA